MTRASAASQNLYRAILSLKTVPEAQAFFRDLLTQEEIDEFAQRWRVAQMLSAAVPYTEIQQTTGMSSTTIARISKWLRTGRVGYQLVLQRLKLYSHQHKHTRMR